MNLFTDGSLKIYYNKITKKVIFMTCNEFISLSPTQFKIIIMMMRADEGEKIILRRNNVDVEFFKFMGGYSITIFSKTYTSTIIICEETLELINENYERISETINKIIGIDI